MLSLITNPPVIIIIIVCLDFTAEQKGDSFFLPCTMFNTEQKWNQREMGRVGRRYFPIFDKKFLFLQFHMEMAGNTGRGLWVLVIVQNPKYIFASSDVSNLYLI